METKQKIELAIRAGKLAKASLELTECHGAQTARFMFVEVVKQLKDIDELIEAMGA
jgi:hypothetical protein